VAVTQHCRPQCIVGTQISDILDVTRTRLHDHAARVSASRLKPDAADAIFGIIPLAGFYSDLNLVELGPQLPFLCCLPV
jgi:hypothetical protein